MPVSSCSASGARRYRRVPCYGRHSEIVPLPEIDPALRSRVFCHILRNELGKIKHHIRTAVRLSSNFTRTPYKGKCTRRPSRITQFIGRYGDRRKMRSPACSQKADRTASSAGIKFRKVTSLISKNRRIAWAASATLAPMPTSPGNYCNFTFQSTPHAASAATIGSHG